MNNTKKWEYWVCCESGNMNLLKEVHTQIKNIPKNIKQEGLEIACACGNKNIVEYILKNMDKCDLDKETCMRIATKNKHINIVTLLLAHSIDRNPNI